MPKQSSIINWLPEPQWPNVLSKLIQPSFPKLITSEIPTPNVLDLFSIKEIVLPVTLWPECLLTKIESVDKAKELLPLFWVLKLLFLATLREMEDVPEDLFPLSTTLEEEMDLLKKAIYLMKEIKLLAPPPSEVHKDIMLKVIAWLDPKKILNEKSIKTDPLLEFFPYIETFWFIKKEFSELKKELKKFLEDKLLRLLDGTKKMAKITGLLKIPGDLLGVWMVLHILLLDKDLFILMNMLSLLHLNVWAFLLKKLLKPPLIKNKDRKSVV